RSRCARQREHAAGVWLSALSSSAVRGCHAPDQRPVLRFAARAGRTQLRNAGHPCGDAARSLPGAQDPTPLLTGAGDAARRGQLRVQRLGTAAGRRGFGGVHPPRGRWMKMTFRFSSVPLDERALRTGLGDPACGGYAAFEGWVRDHNEGRRVRRLEYEAFEPLAIREGERIIAEAIARFGVEHAACVHRTGALEIGESAVWVGVTARHRDEAFRACRYIIDE